MNIQKHIERQFRKLNTRKTLRLRLRLPDLQAQEAQASVEWLAMQSEEDEVTKALAESRERIQKQLDVDNAIAAFERRGT